jgi:hypothetical protein
MAEKVWLLGQPFPRGGGGDAVASTVFFFFFFTLVQVLEGP